MRKQGKRILLSAAVIVACLYSVWPVMLVVTEGFGIDLSPFFSGKGIRFIGGVPYYSGGIFPTTIHYLDVINVEGFPRLTPTSFASGVPSGVERIEYEINLGGADALCVAKSPSGLPNELRNVRPQP